MMNKVTKNNMMNNITKYTMMLKQITKYDVVNSSNK